MEQAKYICYCGYNTRSPGTDLSIQVTKGSDLHPEHVAALKLIEILGGKLVVEQRKAGLFRKQKVYSVTWEDPERQMDAVPIVMGQVDGISEEHQAVLNLLEQIGWMIEPA